MNPPRRHDGVATLATSHRTVIRLLDETGRFVGPHDARLGPGVRRRQAPRTMALDTIRPDERDEAAALLAEVTSGLRDQATGLFHLVRPDGEERLVEVTLIGLSDVPGTPRVLLAITDVASDSETTTALKEGVREATQARFHALLAHSSDLVAVLDMEGTVTYASPSISRLLGYDDEGWAGAHVSHFIHADDLADIDVTTLSPGVPSPPLAVRLRHATHEGYRIFEATITDLSDDPTVGGILVNARDVTERETAQLELRRNREMDRVVRRISNRFATSTVDRTAALLGSTIDEVLGLSGATRADIHVYDETRQHLQGIHGCARGSLEAIVGHSYAISFETLMSLVPRLINGEVQVQHADSPENALFRLFDIPGLETMYGIAVVPLRQGEELLGVMLVSSIEEGWTCPPDVTSLLGTIGEICAGALARQRSEQLLAEQSLRDPLTGLPNRRLLVQRLETALVSSRRAKSWVALMFVDCDGFKDINDTLGHEQGDRLLIELSERLVRVCREGETVARFGGDEFVVMIQSNSPEHTVPALGERIVQSLSEPYECAGRSVRITVSIGVAMHDGSAADIETGALLRRADIAMYRAKQSGRNRMEMFTEEMETRTRERFELVAELRQAVRKRGELVAWYQPIFELDRGQLAGFEALVRWQHPTRGLLAPGHFIDLAEESGLIKELGWQVLETAVEDLITWQSRQLVEPGVSMAVNLSVRQLQSRGFIDDVRALLRTHPIEPDLIEFEVTESVFADKDEVLPSLYALRDLGIQISIDDFGTGYSSLAYLRDLPVDVLKIDRAFVTRLGRPRDDAVIGTVVQLAEHMSMHTVAEGVETRTQLDALRTLGCTYAQGYLMGRPAPADQVQFGSISALM